MKVRFDDDRMMALKAGGYAPGTTMKSWFRMANALPDIDKAATLDETRDKVAALFREFIVSAEQAELYAAPDVRGIPGAHTG